MTRQRCLRSPGTPADTTRNRDSAPKRFVDGPMLSKPLVEAILNNDVAAAQGLVMIRADVNAARDDLGRTPLHLAAQHGLPGLVRVIIGHSAELDACTCGERPRTAVHLAVIGCHNAVLRLLLDAHASTNVFGSTGETPLSLGVCDGNMDAVRLLLKARALADICVEEADDRPGGPVDAGQASSRGCLYSALLQAADRNAERSVVEELVRAGAKLTATDGNKNQPLHLSVRRGNLRVARFLLESRADPNCCNLELQTPLHLAVGLGDTRSIKILVDHKADWNLQDLGGTTPSQMVSNSLTRQLHVRLAPAPAAPAADRPEDVGHGMPAKSSAPPRISSAGGLRRTASPVRARHLGARSGSSPNTGSTPALPIAGFPASLKLPSSAPHSPARRVCGVSLPRHRAVPRGTPHIAWG